MANLLNWIIDKLGIIKAECPLCKKIKLMYEKKPFCLACKKQLREML